MIFICLKIVLLPDSPAPRRSILITLASMASSLAIAACASALILAISGSMGGPPPAPHMSAIGRKSKSDWPASQVAGARASQVGQRFASPDT